MAQDKELFLFVAFFLLSLPESVRLGMLPKPIVLLGRYREQEMQVSKEMGRGLGKAIVHNLVRKEN